MGGAALIIEILAAIGIRTAGIEAIIAVITRIGALPILRTAFVRKKLITWALSIYTLADNAHWLYETVCKYLSKLFDETIESLDFDAIKHAGGRAFAKELNKQLIKKYGISCPITDFASDTIAEEVGEWFADLINEKISQGLGRPVEIISTVFPPDNLPIEIDTFLTDEINLKLGINLSGVLLNPNIAEDLKTAIRDKVGEELTNLIEQAKGRAINNVVQNTGYSPEQIQEVVAALQEGFANTLHMVDSIGFLGNRLSTSDYYARSKKKIHNKMRQREYRRTHVEVRHWEPRT